jgi:hypothetical protein
VPPLRNPGATPDDPSNRPDLGYNGTLINQGLVWGWRTVSENWRGRWENNTGTADSTLPLDYSTVGSSKAVVVMTDGLNFLEDMHASTAYGGPRYFGQDSIGLSFSDPNISPSSGDLAWGMVDSSAYGIMQRSEAGWAGSSTGPTNAMYHCSLRRALAMEPHLNIWGCKEYDSMIRDASGTNHLKSGTGFWGPYDLQSALTGPYYDELTRRLLLTCTNMKARGIRIFFILFAIADNPQKAAAEAAFNSCVGGNGGVYDAANAADLNSAFQAIAIRLRALRLRQ